MNFWEFLDRRLDGRSLLSVGLFALTVMILWMIKDDKSLANNEFFKALAVLIVGTGFINSVVSFWFAQNKASERAADAASKQAEDNSNA